MSVPIVSLQCCYHFGFRTSPLLRRYYRWRTCIPFITLLCVFLLSVASGGKLFAAELINAPDTERQFSSIYGGVAPGTSHGRSQLDSPQAWSAATNNNDQWLELPVNPQQRLVALLTQGRADGNQWVTQYRVQARFPDGHQIYLQGGDTLAGNSDRSTVVRHKLNAPAGVSAIRIEPQAWQSHISMRAAIETETIDDERQYSSIYGNSVPGTGHARSQLHSAQAWSAASNDTNQWLELPVNPQQRLVAVLTQGRANSNQWVTQYRVQARFPDGHQIYLQGGDTLAGNSDRATVVRHELTAPAGVSAIRIEPQSWQSHISMRAAIETEATDDDRRYSSTYENSAPETGYARGQLYSAQAWSAATNDTNQWLELPVNPEQRVVALHTQGRANGNQWVTEYRVQARLADGRLIYLQGGDTLSGNSDRNTVVTHQLDVPHGVSFIRILPQSWQSHISMRAALETQIGECAEVDPLANNLLTNGSFESHASLGAANWGVFSELPGWTVASGEVEVLRFAEGRIRAVAGTDKLELDAFANSEIYTDISTTIGQRYRLNFYYTPRSTQANTHTNDIKVWWGDELLATLRGDKRTWQYYTFPVTADSVSSRLRFEASGASDTLGGFLDEVSVKVDENLLDNGSFESHGVLSNGDWGVFSDIPGWFAQDGQFELQTRSTGGISPYHGVVNLELDSFGNSVIAADVATDVDNAYQLGFVYSPRIQTPGTDTNDVEVWWDGSKLAILSGDQRGWRHYQFLVPGDATGSVLEFRGAGLSDDLGGLIDDVYVMAQPENAAPLALGQQISVFSGESVTITLEGTDVDGETLAYEVVEMPQYGVISDATLLPSLTYTANENYSGADKITFVVSDGGLESEPAAITVTVLSVNTRPTANAGPDVLTRVGERVSLDGYGADSDGDALTYTWSVLKAPRDSNGAIDPIVDGLAAFTPDQVGIYQVRLVTNDGRQDSLPDIAEIIVSDLPPQPTARVEVFAYADKFERQSYFLSAFPSTASNGLASDKLVYRWSIIEPAGSQILKLGSRDVYDVTQDNEPLVLVNFPWNSGEELKVSLTVTDDGVESEPFELVIPTGTTNPPSLTVSTKPQQVVGEVANLDLVVNNFIPFTDDLIQAGFFQAITPISPGWDGEYVTNLKIIERPEGSFSELTLSSDTSKPEPFDFSDVVIASSLYLDVPGTYRILVTADNQTPNGLASEIVTMLATSADNSAPLAAIAGGIDQEITVGDTPVVVALDGTGSSDVDGHSLTYEWSLNTPVGSSAVLIDPQSDMPRFEADVRGRYEVSLTVSDGQAYSETVQSTILAKGPVPNSVPVANVNIQEPWIEGEAVELDGSGSVDAEGDPMTYTWVLEDSPGTEYDVPLELYSGPRSSVEDFFPDVEGLYEFSLVVSDWGGSSEPLLFSVDVIAANISPIAKTNVDRGSVLYSLVGTAVELDGSESFDPEGLPLEYSWEILSAPEGGSVNLNGVSTNSIVEITPDTAGRYVLELAVSDGEKAGNVRIQIEALVRNNQPPVAVFPEQLFADAGEIVSISTSESFDPDGDVVFLKNWSFVSSSQGEGIRLYPGASNSFRFSASEPGVYTLGFTISDGVADSDVVSVDLIVGGVQPVARLFAESPAEAPGTVGLIGEQSEDSNGRTIIVNPFTFATRPPVTYLWELVTAPTGSSASLNENETANPELNVDLPGQYVVQLVVADQYTSSLPAQLVVDVEAAISVTVVADAGPDQVITFGDTVTFDATNSAISEGATVSYEWSDGVTVLSTEAMFTKDDLEIGEHIITLLITDISGVTSEDALTITVQEDGNGLSPIADAGPDRTVSFGDAVVLDGSNSYDPDEDSATYEWFESDVLLSDAVVFTKSDFEVGEHVIRLVVTSIDGYVSEDTVAVSVEGVFVELPDLIGEEELVAIESLELLGFPVRVETVNHPSVPVGVVITQLPIAGNILPFGEEVVLIISEGMDEAAPVITIIGDNPVTVLARTNYVDEGATAFDANDGNVDVLIELDTVDLRVAGEYEVVYSATDRAGNVSTAVRDVIVEVNPDIEPISQAILMLEAAGMYPELDRSEFTPDENFNGVRDDLDQYIDALEESSMAKANLKQLARALQESLDLNHSDPTMVDYALSELALANDCVFSSFTEKSKGYKYAARLEAFTANTRKRADNYIRFERALDGRTTNSNDNPICDGDDK